jgi:EmrB/QacA subfamily drug resistance transporter
MVSKSIERASYKVTFAVLLIGVTAFALLQTLVVPALPTIQRELHTSQSTVTWVLTAYLLTAGIAIPIMGRLGDMLGKERMYLVSLLALGVGSVVAGMADSIWVLIAGRAIQGIGGGVIALSFGIIRDEFPADKVASGIGIMAAMTGAASSLALVIAGPIVAHLNFHWLFWMPLILIIGGAICTPLFVPESPMRSPGRINWAAVVLLSAWLLALLLAISEAPRWGWGSGRVLGLFGLAVMLIVAWVAVEHKSNDPVIDMEMMRARPVWSSNLVTFLFGFGMYAVLAVVPSFVQAPKAAGYGFGASTVQSGLFMLPQSLGIFVMGLAAGKIAARFGSKLALLVGSLVTALAFAMLALAHQHPWQIYVASAFMGTGIGMGYSAMSNIIVQAVPPHQTGVASAMNANIRTIGGAMGSAMSVSIITGSLMASGIPAESGYVRAFLFLAFLSLAAGIAAILVPSGRSLAGEEHLAHAELGALAGGTLTE